MLFDAAVLSPLAAAWDAMEAAMLTRQTIVMTLLHVGFETEPLIG